MSTTLMTVCTVFAVAIELSGAKWIVASWGGGVRQPRQKTLAHEGLTQRFTALLEELAQARIKLGAPESARVSVAYEAGQDGFWLERALREHGIESQVIHPASLKVDRRARRAKTDRLDARALVYALYRYLNGERDALSMVRVPSEATEDSRLWQRQRDRLCSERTARVDRITKLLRTQGVVPGDHWRRKLREGSVRKFSGAPLGSVMQQTLCLELDLLEGVEAALKQLEKTINEIDQLVAERIKMLGLMRGIGKVGARSLALRLLWRDIDNRRQVGALTGLVGTPFASGTIQEDQGISKAGDPRLRGLLIELAWLWLRLQPNSAITQWFLRRTQGAGARGKRVMIVGVARRLAIALWKYVKHGLIPEGARLKVV
ncbi:MAG: IS110 family transposase [Burkholderiales bacterium]